MALIGLLTVGIVFAAGVFWLINNITISTSRNYRYERYTGERGETLERVTEVEKEDK